MIEDVELRLEVGALARRLAVVVPVQRGHSSAYLQSRDLPVYLSIICLPNTVLGLMESLGLPRATIVDSVYRLERQGYIQREARVRDGVISTTPKGRQLFRRRRGYVSG